MIMYRISCLIAVLSWSSFVTSVLTALSYSNNEDTKSLCTFISLSVGKLERTLLKYNNTADKAESYINRPSWTGIILPVEGDGIGIGLIWFCCFVGLEINGNTFIGSQNTVKDVAIVLAHTVSPVNTDDYHQKYMHIITVSYMWFFRI